MRNIFKISRKFSENLSKIFATSTEPDATSSISARSQGDGYSEVMSVREVHSIYIKII